MAVGVAVVGQKRRGFDQQGLPLGRRQRIGPGHGGVGHRQHGDVHLALNLDTGRVGDGVAQHRRPVEVGRRRIAEQSIAKRGDPRRTESEEDQLTLGRVEVVRHQVGGRQDDERILVQFEPVVADRNRRQVGGRHEDIVAAEALRAQGIRDRVAEGRGARVALARGEGGHAARHGDAAVDRAEDLGHGKGIALGVVVVGQQIGQRHRQRGARRRLAAGIGSQHGAVVHGDEQGLDRARGGDAAIGDAVMDHHEAVGIDLGHHLPVAVRQGEDAVIRPRPRRHEPEEGDRIAIGVGVVGQQRRHVDQQRRVLGALERIRSGDRSAVGRGHVDAHACAGHTAAPVLDGVVEMRGPVPVRGRGVADRIADALDRAEGRGADRNDRQRIVVAVAVVGQQIGDGDLEHRILDRVEAVVAGHRSAVDQQADLTGRCAVAVVRHLVGEGVGEDVARIAGVAQGGERVAVESGTDRLGHAAPGDGEGQRGAQGKGNGQGDRTRCGIDHRPVGRGRAVGQRQAVVACLRRQRRRRVQRHDTLDHGQTARGGLPEAGDADGVAFEVEIVRPQRGKRKVMDQRRTHEHGVRPGLGRIAHARHVDHDDRRIARDRPDRIDGAVAEDEAAVEILGRGPDHPVAEQGVREPGRGRGGQHRVHHQLVHQRKGRGIAHGRHGDAQVKRSDIVAQGRTSGKGHRRGIETQPGGQRGAVGLGHGNALRHPRVHGEQPLCRKERLLRQQRVHGRVDALRGVDHEFQRKAALGRGLEAAPQRRRGRGVGDDHAHRVGLFGRRDAGCDQRHRLGVEIEPVGQRPAAFQRGRERAGAKDMRRRVEAALQPAPVGHRLPEGNRAQLEQRDVGLEHEAGGQRGLVGLGQSQRLGKGMATQRGGQRVGDDDVERQRRRFGRLALGRLDGFGRGAGEGQRRRIEGQPVRQRTAVGERCRDGGARRQTVGRKFQRRVDAAVARLAARSGQRGQHAHEAGRVQRQHVAIGVVVVAEDLARNDDDGDILDPRRHVGAHHGGAVVGQDGDGHEGRVEPAPAIRYLVAEARLAVEIGARSKGDHAVGRHRHAAVQVEPLQRRQHDRVAVRVAVVGQKGGRIDQQDGILKRDEAAVVAGSRRIVQRDHPQIDTDQPDLAQAVLDLVEEHRLAERIGHERHRQAVCRQHRRAVRR